MQNSDFKLSVDLNADMGEGFGVYSIGNDEALLNIITSANVACGFHAGDPEIMARTFAMAKNRGVAVGAHPSFPDLWGFGRRVIPCSLGEIERLVAYQIGAAQALATYAGHCITHVKAHGALSNMTQSNREVALAVCKAIKAVDPNLICLSYAGGLMIQISADMGLRTSGEIFADRGYGDDGELIPRREAGAMIHDPDLAAERVLRMVRAGAIELPQGKQIRAAIDTVCIHGDSPNAIVTATRVRRKLEDAGVRVRSFAGERR
jgi:5-oxoprolinase (ATP-hydrolysing) subunit A